MEKEWLTIAELQEWLNLGRSKVYEVASTELPTYRIGRVLRVRRQDVERWLDKNRNEPKA
jgi:excisionase family DNA binding protein